MSKTTKVAAKPAPKKVTKIVEPAPVAPPAMPNEKFPYGIKIPADDGSAAYERFKTVKERDKRVSVIEKLHHCEKVDFTPAAEAPHSGNVSASEKLSTPAKDSSPLKPTLVPNPGAPAPTPINKRITPGARVDEWRIARSLRHLQPGWFLQGGFIEKVNGKKFFRVAEEEHFKSLDKAKQALVAKYPEAHPVGSSTEVG